MKSFYRRAVLTTAIFLLSALVLCLGAAVAPAQAKSLQWLRLDSDITVQPNGDLRIVETNVIRFSNGTFSFGYRDIDPARLTAITDVAVTEQSQPLQFTTSTTDEGMFRIRYTFPPASFEECIFTLAYTVKGATRYYERGDQVYWAGVYAARNGFPVLNSRITVRLPISAAATVADAYGPPFTIKGEGENVVIAESTAPIPSGQEFEIRVQFPHGLISGEATPWQQEFDQQLQYEEFVRPRNNIIFLLIGLALLFGGPALAVVLWFSRGRDPNVGLVAKYLNEPPTGLSPGLAGALVDEHADMQDIVATLVDLARRGMIVIQEGSERGLFDQTFTRGPDFPASAFSSSRALTTQPQSRESSSLALHEWALLDALGLDALPQRALSAFQDMFYSRTPAIKEALYHELVNAGYYHNSPEQSRSRYRNFGNNSPASAATLKGDSGTIAVAPPASVTLEGVNVQLTQSLASLNTRLVDMFSSVGNTFASHPPPQSVTAAKDTLADLGDMFDEWLSNAGSGSSDGNRSGSRSSSSSGRSWSGGGSHRGGSSGRGGGGFG